MSAFEQCLLLHIVQCLLLCCKWRRLLAERERRRGAVARGKEERGGGVGELHAAGCYLPMTKSRKKKAAAMPGMLPRRLKMLKMMRNKRILSYTSTMQLV